MKDSIGYSGRVTVRLSVHNSNGYHFKNEGKKLLWNLLARAVTGNDVSAIQPKSIGIFQKVADGDDILLTYTPIPIYGKVWGDVVSISEDSTSALFSATASYSDRKQLATGKVILKLLTATDEVLAEVEDIDDMLKSIHNAMIPGIDAVYEWQLVFKNISTEKQETTQEQPDPASNIEQINLEPTQEQSEE